MYGGPTHDHLAPGQGRTQTGHIASAKVKGPKGNLIMSLASWSINMLSPYRFQIMVPDNEVETEWQYTPGHSTKQFYMEFQQHIELKLWQQATEHRHGQGLMPSNMAPDLLSTRTDYSALIKKGQDGRRGTVGHDNGWRHMTKQPSLREQRGA